MRKTRLQLALDTLTMEQALELLKKIHKQVDIVEIGTPMLIEYGLEAVRCFRRHFPSLELLCDGKIMDAGELEAESMFRAGADYVTVLGVTDDATVADCVSTAVRYGGKTVADMICVDVDNISQRVQILERLGVDYIAIHTGVDQQKKGRTPLDDLREVSTCVFRAGTAVACGITVESLASYLVLKPDIVIVGGGICNQKDPEAAVLALSQQLEGV